MNTDLAKNLIQQLHEMEYHGNLYFHLLGEPLLHPKIFEIIKYAVRKDSFNAVLLTNGSLLTKKNIKQVFTACPSELLISMQLADEKTFNLRGSNLSWNRYISRIKDTIHYKLTHDSPTSLRISVGVKKKMQRLARENSKTVMELQGLVEEVNTPREKAARRFIIEGFKGKMSSLIPFALENESILNLASYLLKYTRSKSKATLYQYVFGVHRFCRWLGKSPDDIVKNVLFKEKMVEDYVGIIDSFIGDLQAEDLAPGTINNHVKGVKALFRVNGVALSLPYRLPKHTKFSDRAPTPEELSKVIDMANIKEKTVISILALSAIRIGTLVKLTYGHVKQDLEAGTVPVHIHVQKEITKDKYHDYDTFIGSEAVQYLKAYLNIRRRGTTKISPETLTNDSPLIRNECRNKVFPVSPAGISKLVHTLLLKADIIKKGKTKRYPVRPHSLRKYFRTQLGAISTIPTDYIEYMMGHTISTYNDIRMKGVEYLRNLYASSGLSIRARTKISKIDRIKMFVESLGLNPDEILSKEALVKPHRTVVDHELKQIEVLNTALKEAILKELKNS
jgi:integrase